MMPKNFIVAIELGSSKMTGIAGQKNLDGSIQVLAVVKEESSSFIRKGYVYNIDKTAQCLASIVSKPGETTQDDHHTGLCGRRRTVHTLRSQCHLQGTAYRHDGHPGYGH